jgi:hypothetical protein
VDSQSWPRGCSERRNQFSKDKIEIDRYLDDVRAQLDERTFEKARAEGRAMSLEDAVALALDENVA